MRDDDEWAGIRLMASSTENYAGNTPHMNVWCRADGQDVYFSVTFPDERLEGAGAYWLNGTRHSATNWVTINNNDQTVRWGEIQWGEPRDIGHSRAQNWFRDTLFKMIENPGTFKLQANDDSTTPPTAEFDLTGLPEAVRPVRETCGILPTEITQTAADGWVLVRNDGNWAGIRLMASSTENYAGNTPHMNVWCRADGQDVYFSVTFPDERLEGAGAYWLNGTRHSATNWVTIGNNDQTVRWGEIQWGEPRDIGHSRAQNWFRDTLFKMIENPGTFKLQANDDSTTPPTAEFDLTGLPEAVRPVRETCGI